MSRKKSTPPAAPAAEAAPLELSNAPDGAAPVAGAAAISPEALQQMQAEIATQVLKDVAAQHAAEIKGLQAELVAARSANPATVLAPIKPPATATIVFADPKRAPQHFQ